VLDVACGGGRHTRWLLEQGYRVVAVDVDVGGVADLRGHPGLEIVEADLEDGNAFPLRGRAFDGVVVTRYLHRPILPDIVGAVGPGGVLIYETFAQGLTQRGRFGRPTKPDYLLRPGELLDAVSGALRVLAYEDLVVTEPRPAALQRICARRQGNSSTFPTVLPASR